MKLSDYFLKPRKDIPSDATLISHKLMIKSSMIKQTTSGIYAWLPLGLKVLKKIEDIIRNFHNLYGCQELLMPTIQSSSIWKKSGRYNDNGPEMLKFHDRSKKELLYGPTNEELITEIFKDYIKSYKDLPKNLYQIHWKFRDEIRPRYGVMRCREFLMKDNYSFDLSQEEAKISYNKMFTAYIKTFLRMGLTPISLRADTGQIGGDLSHEFQILAKTGESTLYYDKELETLDPEKIEPEKLQSYYAAVDDIHDEKNCPINQDQLKISKGIEVGHIFYFGTKYSEKLGAYVQDNKGEKRLVHMGSYGIGISRLVGAIIEAFHDDRGIIWPIPVAPFHLSLINLMTDDDKCNEVSENLYNHLLNKNIEVLYDDRKFSMGKKLSDNDLIGIPYQIIIGKRDLKENLIEVKDRKTYKSQKLDPDQAFNFLINEINSKI